MLRFAGRSLPGARCLTTKRLRFSTTSSAPVKEDSFIDKVKRWSKRLSPLLAFCFTSSFVIGNLTIRHYTESLFPAYVNFLREYYGFDDEDVVERARVAAIEANNAKAVSADIWFENGECLEGVILEGGASYKSSIDVLEQQHKSLVCRVDFNDSKDDTEQEGGDEGDATPFASTMSSDTLGLHASSTEYMTAFHSSPEEEVKLGAYASSSWDRFPPVNTTSGGQQKTNPLLKEVSSASVFQRYANLMPSMAMDRSHMAEVKESMRQNNRSGGRQYAARAGPVLGFGSPMDSPPSPAPAAVDQEIEKHQAIQSITRLEQRIAQCKDDMQIGSRDVDSVMAEIQGAKEEIATLKRKFVNRFYYF